MLSYLFKRLKEPSTYAGLALTGSFLQGLPTVLAGAATVPQLVVGIVGLLAVILPEHKATPQ